MNEQASCLTGNECLGSCEHININHMSYSLNRRGLKARRVFKKWPVGYINDTANTECPRLE